MPLNKSQKDKLKKDVETLWKTSPAKALKKLATTAKFKSKRQKNS